VFNDLQIKVKLIKRSKVSLTAEFLKKKRNQQTKAHALNRKCLIVQALRHPLMKMKTRMELRNKYQTTAYFVRK